MQWYRRNFATVTFMIVIIFALCSACNTYHKKVLNFREKSPIVLTLRHAVKLRPDGTVIAIPKDYSDFKAPGISVDIDAGQCDTSEWRDIVSIAASNLHTVGLKLDGTVIATGNNRSGECNTSKWKDIIDIAAGSGFTIGLKSNGTVVFAADDKNIVRDALKEWTNIAAVYANAHQIAGLKLDGTVVVAGSHDSEGIDVSEWKDIIDVSISPWHIVGLKLDGTVVAKARQEVNDGMCDVSEWEDIVAISTCTYGTVGLKSDGTLEACGKVASKTENTAADDRIFRLKKITAISACSNDLMVLTEDHRVGLYGEFMRRPFTEEEFEKLQG